MGFEINQSGDGVYRIIDSRGRVAEELPAGQTEIREAPPGEKGVTHDFIDDGFVAYTDWGGVKGEYWRVDDHHATHYDVEKEYGYWYDQNVHEYEYVAASEVPK